MSQVKITTFYHFTKLSEDEVKNVKSELETFAERNTIRGLVLIGPEGLNLTISGDETALGEFKNFVGLRLKLENPFFKDSESELHPFRDFKVKIKDEIVTLGRPGLVPDSVSFNHLSPKDWHQALKDPDTLVIDTRNNYETEIGKFKNALDFDIEEFSEFPEKLKTAELPKDKPVLIYCTGGIRCEKAILAMHEQGFEKVYQLEGGILNYLKEYPNQEFAGECFVFDYRVAVDQNLNATKNFKLCPHCGQPANQPIACELCQDEVIICVRCLNSGNQTCSKNCSHHKKIGSSSSRTHMQEKLKRDPV